MNKLALVNNFTMTKKFLNPKFDVFATLSEYFTFSEYLKRQTSPWMHVTSKVIHPKYYKNIYAYCLFCPKKYTLKQTFTVLTLTLINFFARMHQCTETLSLYLFCSWKYENNNSKVLKLHKFPVLFYQPILLANKQVQDWFEFL